jgi:hypothetical protein
MSGVRSGTSAKPDGHRWAEHFDVRGGGLGGRVGHDGDLDFGLSLTGRRLNWRRMAGDVSAVAKLPGVGRRGSQHSKNRYHDKTFCFHMEPFFLSENCFHYDKTVHDRV